MSLYDGESRIMIGYWIQAKFEGELVWRWDVETYEPMYEEDLNWDLEEYVAFIKLPERIPVA